MVQLNRTNIFFQCEEIHTDMDFYNSFQVEICRTTPAVLENP